MHKAADFWMKSPDLNRYLITDALIRNGVPVRNSSTKDKPAPAYCWGGLFDVFEKSVDQSAEMIMLS
jgi:hypothetical protein